MAKVIKVNGAIVSDQHKEIYDEWKIENTAPKDIFSQLPKKDSEPIEIHISSGGGDAYAGFLIYTKLKDYKGKKTVKILNIAASAASIIAMVGDEVLISPVGQLMIHNAWTTQTGNQHAMREVADQLEQLAESLINAYELRTNQPREQIQKWLDKETYFSAHKAVEYGFADEVMYSESRTQNRVIAACIGVNGLLSESVIDEYLQKKNEPEPVVKNKQKRFLFM
ncbi:Clp protease ClpP [Lysinibacillus sp. OL1_EC]|uniref:head maturation protease, ClpP-related n=1 Tax=unclassified Lysinibacillus TaxID=2636778 RepID=UPI00103F9A27|nr:MULTISPECIES: head maturation protease, ClpP-related [unclassified Lysinibacillus]MCM0626682.1 Clp protease ClpP [Lysinibacillus sp. OL1_EC]TBV89152.1 Clp protease ClpP [Lysinibacillus sp. OL1]